MIIFWKLLYNIIFLPLMVFLTLIVALFNKKLRTGIMGRLSSLSILKTHFSDEKNKAPVYWFHAASHGEYEQIRPVIKGLKDVEPTARILVSFFSPSGFNHVKDDNIECKVYLPFDFPWTIT